MARDVIRGIKRSLDIVIGKLQASANCVTVNELLQIASTAAQNIAKLIWEGMANVGQDSVVSTDESKSQETFLEIAEGMEFDRGLQDLDFALSADSMGAQRGTRRCVRI